MERIVVSLFNITKALLRFPLIAVGEYPDNLLLNLRVVFEFRLHAVHIQ